MQNRGVYKKIIKNTKVAICRMRTISKYKHTGKGSLQISLSKNIEKKISTQRKER